jgi:hypothetical protein
MVVLPTAKRNPPFSRMAKGHRCAEGDYPDANALGLTFRQTLLVDDVIEQTIVACWSAKHLL